MSHHLLNIGCGSVVHPEWINLDSAPIVKGVIAHDLRRGLPFSDESFDAVYGSHVLEHLTPSAGRRLLRECLRVLRSEGIVRLVVPDLESIVRLYLQSLEGSLAGDVQAQQRYDWMMLELYDQTVRTAPGGEMGAYLREPKDRLQGRFVADRVGEEGLAYTPTGNTRPARTGKALLALRRLAASIGVFFFLGREGCEALREGLFRRGGEPHKWMYDRFSMRRALEQVGFAEVRVCSADDSEIPDFARFGLETRDGRPRKPDSLYVEARKPPAGRGAID